jgi:hypothetical protein
MRRLAVLTVIAAVAVTPSLAVAATPSVASAAPPPLYGVTIDSISGLSSLVAGLAALPERATARVYFDVHEPASYYADAVKTIHGADDVMGELLDSSDETAISTAALRTRTSAYLAALGSSVDIWEIGNEVNGNWTGPYTTVAAKLAAAYAVVHAAGRPTALTLYENSFGPDNCGDGAAELTPLQFARRYVSATVRAGLTYVFLSYYPTQCGGVEPTGAQLNAELVGLHKLFPAAELGFGELGLPHAVTATTLATAEQVMSWGYGLDPGLPYYVGGYFWWYAAEDALQPSGLLAGALPQAFEAEHAALTG